MKTMTAIANVQYPKFLLSLSALIICWFFFSYQGLVSAFDIWYISEIFQHCFFVIPGALYLIYLQRQALAGYAITPSYWATPFILGQIVVYVVGVAGDVQLLMHLALFSLLPTLIWFAIGNKAAWHIVFPLFFMMFSIPIGEELIPFLQEVTADISVYFLGLTGVPLFRSGLYIEIPEGRFLVAEACSGISFFIASIVIGNLYAYMNLHSPVRRILFVGLAILYPILANAIRVYGIILTGHLTDMQHAVGADHLIYGWFFFAIVIISLVLIGELFRRGDIVPDMITVPPIPQPEYRMLPVFGIIVVLVLGIIWSVNVANPVPSPTAKQSIPMSFESATIASLTATPWHPEFNAEASQDKQTLTHAGLDFEIYQVAYSAEEGELVGFQNKLYAQERWTLVDTSSLDFDNGLSVLKQDVISVRSEKRDIYFAYWFDDKFYTSKTQVKLAQTFALLLHQSGEMRMLALSVESPTDSQITRQQQALIKSVFAEFASNAGQLDNITSQVEREY